MRTGTIFYSFVAAIAIGWCSLLATAMNDINKAKVQDPSHVEAVKNEMRAYEELEHETTDSAKRAWYGHERDSLLQSITR